VLVLLRHGESTANATRLLAGRMDVPLTEHGRRQAAALAALLGPVARLVSSPLGRARDSAAALGLPVPVDVDAAWVEVDYGADDGRRLDELTAESWRRWRTDPAYRPDGGETLAEVGVRVRAACAALFAEEGAGARDPDGDVVVVSHVSPIKAAVAWALGADDGTVWRLHLSTGSLTRIGWGGAGPVLHTYNALPLTPAG
jgi:broad specificity phosphatase PhoE